MNFSSSIKFRYTLRGWVIGAAVCLLLTHTVTVKAASPPEVLILNSYHKEFKWTDAQVNAAREALKKVYPDLKLSVEYMDTKRTYNRDYLETLSKLYSQKYKNVTFDAIIATDDNALRFALKHHKDLFNEAPVCFCGINDYEPGFFYGKTQFTGVLEILDIQETIDLALKLHPNTRKIVVVVDSTPTGRGQLKDIKAAAAEYKNLKFEYLEGKNFSHKGLLSKLRALKEDSIVLLAVWLRDKNNAYLPSEEGGRLISENAPVPVYGIIDMYLGDGIVGGKLLSSRSHGRIAAEKALQVLAGKDPSYLPILHHSTNPYMFDDRQLRRWNITVSSLPKNSIVIHAPSSIYDAYKGIVWSVVGVILFLICAIIFMGLNMARRKRAEAALRDSEERYRTVFQNTGAATVLLEADMTISMANTEFEKLTGFSRDEIERKKKWTEFVVPEDLEIMIQYHVERRKNSGKAPGEYEFKLMDRHGNLKEIFLKIGVVPGSDKSVASLIDVTLLKRTQAALIKSEHEKKAILDGITTSIRFVDKDLNIVWLNKACAVSAGKAAKDIIGHKCYEFWGDGKRPCGNCPAVKTFKSKKTKEVTSYGADGRIWDLKTEPVFDTDGELAGVVEIAHDITEQSRLEEQLQRSQKMEAIGTLAGGVAHDLNNILSGIVSYPELILLDLSEDSPLRDSMLTIKKSGEKAAAIVQDLLTLARRGVAVRDVTDLNDVIEEYLKSPECRNLLSGHPGVRVKTHLERQALKILGSSTHLSKTIMNLISNAAEAIPHGGLISITTENRYIDKPIKGYDDVQEGDYVALTVADTGVGISTADLPHIFEAFYTKKKMGRSGTGLGMAVVWGTVKDHNGYIDVKSVEGKGTTFTLYFPVTRRAFEAKEAEKNLADYRGHGELILIVDDISDQRNIASKMVTALGYRAATVPSGEAAIEYLKKHCVDLVLLDMIMDPGMDGLETYRKIIEIHPGQRAVIASGFSESSRVKALQKLGAGEYVKKPLLLQTIGPAIQKELQRG